ncbi:MAG: hypothetical protein PVJ39_17715 [Gammaproteobacteria bacterium]|jgi:hypothetical protein
MKNERRTGLENRRTGNERRIYHKNFGFPFIDSHGQLVTEERRLKGERRRASSSRQLDDEEQCPSAKLTQKTASA